LDLEFVTVIRRAERDTARFADELWDYMMLRCLSDSMYWAYGLPKRKPTDLNDLEEGEIVEDYVSLRVPIAQGKLEAPKVSWCTWSREEWAAIVDRARKIEDERLVWEEEKRKEEEDAELALLERLFEERNRRLRKMWSVIFLYMAVSPFWIVVCSGVSVWAPSCYTYLC